MFPFPIGNPIFARGLKNLHRDSSAHTDHLTSLDLGELGGVPPFVFSFPAKITNGQSGLHAWVEREYLPATGQRVDRIGGRSGTVTGLDSATSTNDPAHMPDESTLTGFPQDVWLTERITNDAQGRHYEILTGPPGTVVDVIELYNTGVTPPTGYLDGKMSRWDVSTDTLVFQEYIWIADVT